MSSQRHQHTHRSASRYGSSVVLKRAVIPIPVSVDLYNLVVDNHIYSTTTSSSTISATTDINNTPAAKNSVVRSSAKTSSNWFYPKHSTSLLHQVRLEIVITIRKDSASRSTSPSTSTVCEGIHRNNMQQEEHRRQQQQKGDNNTNTDNNNPNFSCINGNDNDNDNDNDNNKTNENTTTRMNSNEEEKILYSCTYPRKTVHPSWDHLDERIAEEDLHLLDHYDTEANVYRSMKMRFYLVHDDPNDNDCSIDVMAPPAKQEEQKQETQTQQSSQQQISIKDSSSKEFDQQSKQPQPQTQSQSQSQLQLQQLPPPSETLFLEVPVHPTKLRKIAMIPESLPLNALIIRFSDDSFRVTPSLIHIIQDSDHDFDDKQKFLFNAGGGGGNNKQSLSSSASHYMAAEDDFTRFGDDMFRTLDEVTPSKLPRTALFSSSLSSQTSEQHSSSGAAENNFGIGTFAILPEEQFYNHEIEKELFDDDHDDDDDDADNNNAKHNEDNDNHNNDENYYFDQEVVRSLDQLKEKQRMEQLIIEEKEAIQNELKAINEESLELRKLMDSITKIESNIVNLQEKTKIEKQQYEETEFVLEAWRIKLVRDLRYIYPIQILLVEQQQQTNNNGYTSISSTESSNSTSQNNNHHCYRYKICNCEISATNYDFMNQQRQSNDNNKIVGGSVTVGNSNASVVVTGASVVSSSGVTVTDEELSAGIGYACHLLLMLSKYLSIPLRYRLYCHQNPSKSAIQDDVAVAVPSSSSHPAAAAAAAATNTSYNSYGTSSSTTSSTKNIIYPLFLQGRVIDRDEFDYGYLLLHRNVECILKTRNIPYNPNEHILRKLNRIYESVME